MHPLRFWLLLSVATVAAVSQLPGQAAPFSPQASPEKPDLETALRQAQRGVTERPESVRLRLVEADILERLGRHYPRRRKLREAAAALGDVRLLRELAETEDLFGPRASEAYAKLADGFRDSDLASSDYFQALHRGLFVSLRDGNLDKGRWFIDKLSQDFHFGPGTVAVYTRAAPKTTSFRAEPCTSPPPVGARARPSAHRR